MTISGYDDSKTFFFPISYLENELDQSYEYENYLCARLCTLGQLVLCLLRIPNVAGSDATRSKKRVIEMVQYVKLLESKMTVHQEARP